MMAIVDFKTDALIGQKLLFWQFITKNLHYEKKDTRLASININIFEKLLKAAYCALNAAFICQKLG